MHEVGIMQSVLEIAEQQARTAGAARILEIRLRVGRLTGVVPEALDFAFTTLRDGTMAGGATLAVEYVPGAGWCTSCACEFEAEGLFAECPRCGQPSLAIRRGRELDVVSLEVE